jgi:hypothetical protein
MEQETYGYGTFFRPSPGVTAVRRWRQRMKADKLMRGRLSAYPFPIRRAD